jgi:hypothetical protein
MTVLGYILMSAALLLVTARLKRDFVGGLCFAAAAMMVLPDELAFPLGFADLTVQRIIILIVASFWLRERSKGYARETVPFCRLFSILLITQLISLGFSIAPSDSFKNLLSLFFEGFVFFVILFSTLNTEAQLLRAARTLTAALVVVAALAVIERYSEINLPRRFLLGEGANEEGDITSVFRHRIMLGYAMAAVLPYSMFLVARSLAGISAFLNWAGTFLVIAACYFSFSRGPWIGLLLALTALAVLGRGRLRHGVLVIIALTALMVAVRPGIRTTIVDLVSSLLVTDTENNVKASSAKYRKRLWYVAWNEIAKAPERFLFGYGANSTMHADYSDYFGRMEGGSTSKLGFTSWDNQFALNLIERGSVGFLAGTALYLGLLVSAARHAKDSAPGLRKDLAIAALVSMGVHIWACTNVAIFNPQLTWIFLLSSAISIRAGLSAGRLGSRRAMVRCDPSLAMA